MIKAVIFDVGGVLIRTQDYVPRRALEQRLGLAEWESETLVFSGDDGTKAQQGAITDAELWRRIARRLQLDEELLRQFREAFWAGDVLDRNLIAHIERLHAAGYQTAIISNATDNLRRLLSAEHQIAAAFDLIVCSAEEKVMKPDPEIYRRTLERLQRRPSETIFVDDSKPNIDAARALGMHAIHYREGVDLSRALAQLGVALPGEVHEMHSKERNSGGKENV